MISIKFLCEQVEFKSSSLNVQRFVAVQRAVVYYIHTATTISRVDANNNH